MLALGLLPPLTARRGPREVGHGNDEEAVAGVGDTGQGIVPRQERGKETEETSSLDDLLVGRAIVVQEIAQSEHQEGKVQEEEQQEEGDRRLQGAQQQDGGEDEPTLEKSAAGRRSDQGHGTTHHEEQAKGVAEHRWIVARGQGSLDLESTGGEHNADCDPETAVRGQSSGTKGVSNRHLPFCTRAVSW